MGTDEHHILEVLVHVVEPLTEVNMSLGPGFDGVRHEEKIRGRSQFNKN